MAAVLTDCRHNLTLKTNNEKNCNGSEIQYAVIHPHPYVRLQAVRSNAISRVYSHAPTLGLAPQGVRYRNHLAAGVNVYAVKRGAEAANPRRVSRVRIFFLDRKSVV